MAGPKIVAVAEGDDHSSLWAALSDGSIWRLYEALPDNTIPNYRGTDIFWTWEKVPAIPKPASIIDLGTGDDKSSLWAGLSDGSVWRLFEQVPDYSLPGYRGTPDIQWGWEKVPDIPAKTDSAPEPPEPGGLPAPHAETHYIEGDLIPVASFQYNGLQSRLSGNEAT